MKFLIIGSGLAGLSFSERAIQDGHDIKVLSNTNEPSSTSAATGMYNPVVFRRVEKSWMIDELLPVMHSFYSALEQKLNIELVKPILFDRQMPNDHYQELWNKRATEEDFKPFIKPANNSFGEVLQAGIVDCALLKQSYEEFLKSQNLLIESTFDQSLLIEKDGGLFYDGQMFDSVIYCEGATAAQNPLFSWLPWNICKGEWLKIETENEVHSRAVNGKTNIIPEGEKTYKLSSTFSWEDFTLDPTIEAREELCEAFKQSFDVPFTIKEQVAGLRPTVADRRPYLGTHPQNKKLFIFNGLGTKGVMLAPYFSKHLLEHIVDQKPLMEEVNIQRHIKRFNHHIGLYR